jgi:integrase/recombinase XerD
MTSLRQAVQNYLALRRSLGFKLRCTGLHLLRFVAFAESHGAEYVTTPLALEWAMQPADRQPATWAERMKAIRVFARYQHVLDDRTEIPPPGLLPYRPQRTKPYLYSNQEIRRLLSATRRLRSSVGIRPRTYRCLIGLLAVSGLRISEALALRSVDVDFKTRILSIRESKFRKSRLVPLHRSTIAALRHYAAYCNSLFPAHERRTFFISDLGRALEPSAVRRTFYELSRWAGLRRGPVNRGPRLHDFRHRFAVQTMIGWYRAGEDVQRRLPILSTYLGHAHVGDTYWYLTQCPELMQWACKRLERRWEMLS